MQTIKNVAKRTLIQLFIRFQKMRERYEISIIRKMPGLRAEKSTKFIGCPIIGISPGAQVVTGRNVTLNSNNKGYHLNMHSPVKLMADQSVASITIGDRTRINGACLHASSSISIGRNCLIAANVQIFDNNGHDLSFQHVENRINTIGESQPIVIEDNVWIGANTIVLPGVHIGHGSVVAAGSVVSKDVPPMVLVGGVPAIIIKKAIDYSDSVSPSS